MMKIFYLRIKEKLHKIEWKQNSQGGIVMTYDHAV